MLPAFFGTWRQEAMLMCEQAEFPLFSGFTGFSDEAGQHFNLFAFVPAQAHSYSFHPLKGSRKGQYAVNANGPWRVVFTPTEDSFEDVEITNYHNG